MPQRYFIGLRVYDLEAKRDMVDVAYESNYLDEIISTMRSYLIDLSKVQKERDKDRYELVYQKGVTPPERKE